MIQPKNQNLEKLNEVPPSLLSTSSVDFSFIRDNTQTQLNPGMAAVKKPEKIVIKTSETDALYN